MRMTHFWHRWADLVVDTKETEDYHRKGENLLRSEMNSLIESHEKVELKCYIEPLIVHRWIVELQNQHKGCRKKHPVLPDTRNMKNKTAAEVVFKWFCSMFYGDFINALDVRNQAVGSLLMRNRVVLGVKIQQHVRESQDQ